VRASVAILTEPTLVLDLGGGSLELAVGEGTELRWAASTDLGVSRLSASVERDPMRRRDVERLRALVDGALEPLLPIIAGHEPHTIVAVGGAVRALARVLAARSGAWLPATLNQAPLDPAQLAATAEELRSLDLDGRLAVPGMKSRRADRAHIAATILERVVDRLGADRVVVSDWGLREGTILDAVGARDLPDAVSLRSDAVARFRRAFTLDDAHAEHVARLAERLFEGMTDIHGLPSADRELLRHAAMLHDIGRSIALRRYHQHGAYLVQHAEMRGFSPEEMAVVTTLVRFHASRGTDPSYPPLAAMSDVGRDRVHRLLALLQVADGLDRARDQGVHDLGMQRRDGRLELVLHGRGLAMARTEVERAFALFRRTFDVDLRVVDRLGMGA
jgi:exopolyphosphatase / guanosine-5'-triphosphate,3'-diphosphate pyrophosphatase